MEDFQNNNELTFKEEQDNSFGLKDAVAIFLRNIHWFVLSVLVCMTVAVRDDSRSHLVMCSCPALPLYREPVRTDDVAGIVHIDAFSPGFRQPFTAERGALFLVISRCRDLRKLPEQLLCLFSLFCDLIDMVR